MRRPTTEEVAYRWHAAMLEAQVTGGKGPPIHENDPQCGFFMKKRTNHRDSDFVPCRIFLESPTDPVTGELTGPEVMRCEIDGRRVDVSGMWTWLAGRPISEDRYMEMIAGSFRMTPEPEKVAAAPAQILTSDAPESDPAPTLPKPPQNGTQTVF